MGCEETIGQSEDHETDAGESVDVVGEGTDSAIWVVFDEHLVEDRVVRPDDEHWKPDREDEELHDLVLWVDDSSTPVYFVPSYT
ncbi:hypothetical protein [Haloarchaeobius sp. FL176]|uniref:hypothetical protein n=1 Tax=Haloarchaeobius sp. FL176 TaxID=2967129 RepID=UPI002149666E|nr:hypothetical protein [Haloarchaeobius sp. FL176]